MSCGRRNRQLDEKHFSQISDFVHLRHVLQDQNRGKVLFQKNTSTSIKLTLIITKSCYVLQQQNSDTFEDIIMFFLFVFL